MRQEKQGDSKVKRMKIIFFCKSRKVQGMADMSRKRTSYSLKIHSRSVRHGESQTTFWLSASECKETKGGIACFVTCGTFNLPLRYISATYNPLQILESQSPSGTTTTAYCKTKSLISLWIGQ